MIFYTNNILWIGPLFFLIQWLEKFGAGQSVDIFDNFDVDYGQHFLKLDEFVCDSFSGLADKNNQARTYTCYLNCLPESISFRFYITKFFLSYLFNFWFTLLLWSTNTVEDECTFSYNLSSLFYACVSECTRYSVNLGILWPTLL